MRSQFWNASAKAAVLGLLLTGCGRVDIDVNGAGQGPRLMADIARTSYGIPHVRAEHFRGLGYGLAYAYAQDNVCMFADTILTVNGERSRYFGGEAPATQAANGEYGAAIDYLNVKNEDSDFFFKSYIDIEQQRAAYAAGTVEARDLLTGYVDGYNRYLKDAAGRLPAACAGAAWVRPITLDDMIRVLAEKALHGSGEVFAQEIVNAARTPGTIQLAKMQAKPGKRDIGFMQRRLDKLTSEQLGSNGIAIGRDLSATGAGLLLGNPHYPWTSTDRFYQAHLTVPGRYDAMGVVLGGIPMVVIGFNKDIAWTHTVTKAVHFTTFKLTLDTRDPTGTTYLYDGQPVKMSAKTVTVDVLQNDGKLAQRSKTFYFSKQGAVLVYPEAGMVWNATEATVLGDPNRNNTRMLEQWIAMGQSNSVPALKAALDKHAGLPWVNTVAADRNGNAMYADASVVPLVTSDKFVSDCFLVPPLLTFDGSRSACAWGNSATAPAGIFSPADGPFMIRTDYAANSNDSYWLSNARQLLTGPAPLGYSPLYGPTDAEQSLRTRIAFRQLEQMIAQRGRLVVGDLQTLAFANRIYAAELVLPELLPLCLNSPDQQTATACAALNAWDRKADLDSRGAVLFREFWNQAAEIPGLWQVPLDVADPVNTPRGLAPSATPALLAALKSAAQKLTALNIPFNGRLGDYQDDTRNGVRVPVHGGIGDIDGSFNSIHMRTGLTASGYHGIIWGTSYVQTVTFDNAGPVAYAMLTYGQSVDPKNPHYADQVPLYSRKEFPLLPFTPEKIRADPAYQLTRLRE
ncbi:penicillin acylase family protein [Massilia sp. CF038]|uniref:penicillin acylase family protein n=1 Tax=Massilia sp. CF038 TaxID=1881045 RepID=UPI000923EEC6|nr:penicillin acylase family protein [Massilia sp. CF038]SHH73599.1 acyl-homoserine-lactone acylase [Massilia sp. CF038]